MQTLAVLLIGFSLFYSLILSLTHFRCENYKNQTIAQIMGVVLLLSLSGLQIGHYYFLQGNTELVHSVYYSILLFSVAPAFYLFSKPLLKAQTSHHPIQFLHLLPVLLVFFLPDEYVLPLSFLLGVGYLLWLAKSIYALREQRNRFYLELLILAAVFVIAFIVLILGLSLPLISEQLFITLYAASIGFAFLLISLVVSYAPQISNHVVEAAQETYAISTLDKVDCDACLQDLQSLMQKQHLYRENNLDLHALASELTLSSHQLSELINTKLGKSFSRYIREQRVNAAKIMLFSEPSSSVLSVGFSVGFTSQSNFYEAFREIVGTTPGRFRKLNG